MLLKYPNTLTAILSGSFTTTAPSYSVSYSSKSFRQNSTGALATTATTLVSPSNSSDDYAEVSQLQIYNGDTAACTVTVNENNGTTNFGVGVFTLSVGDTLSYTPASGWSVKDNLGRVKSTATFGLGVVTSNSANAFTAGPNGTTNPTFNVDASTASAATGLNVKGAAAAAGCAVTIVSSGTNESGTIDAKGTGTITINGVGGTGAVQVGGAASGNNATGVKFTPNAAGSGVDVAVVSTGSNEAMTIEAKGTSSLKLNATTACTGAVQIGGAASGNNATGLTITPNAAGSGVAIAVVSTGTNENLTENAKGSGTITVGGISTGVVSIGRGSTSQAVFSSTKTTVSTQNSTPTAAQLLGGYIDHNSTTGAGTATLDTGTNLDSAIPGVSTGDMFQCVYVNRGSQTVTVTTATGLTLRGTLAIPSGKNALLDFFRTGTGTWDVAVTVSA